MRRSLRILAAIAKWAAIVVVAAAAIVVVINLFDESPTPAALALAEPPAAPPTTDNAYFALVGFSAPAGVDPAEDGKRRVAEHDASARSTRLRFAGERRAACGTFDTVSVGDALAKVGALRALHAANGVLVERYVAIRKLPGFAITAVPGIMQPGPYFSDWSAVQQLLLCEALVDAQSGRAAQALSFIGDDLQFLRRMLAGNGNLLTEMIATAFAARDLHALSSLIATPGFPAEPNAAALRAMLAPLEMPGAGMARALASEHAMQVALLQQLPTTPESPPPDDETLADKFERLIWPPWLERRFYNPQATLNRSAESFHELIALANDHPAEFLAARERLRARFA